MTLLGAHDLGSLRCEQGDFARGLPLLREAVAGRLKALGAAHPKTQQATKNLATFEKQEVEKLVEQYTALGADRQARFRSLASLADAEGANARANRCDGQPKKRRRRG